MSQMMLNQAPTLNDFLVVVGEYADIIDDVSAARIYSAWRKSKEDVCDFVCRHLPVEDEVPLSDICSSDHSAIARACKWFAQQHIDVHDTISGIFVSQDGALALSEFLRNSIPLYPAYIEFCDDAGMEPSYADYYRLLTLCKNSVSKTRWHPLQLKYTEFWMQSPEELLSVLRRWAAEENMDKPVADGYVSVSAAAEQLQMPPKKLMDWLVQHSDCYTCRRGQYLLDPAWLAQVSNIWAHAQTLADIIDDVVSGFPAGKRKDCKNATITWVKSQTLDWILPADLYPQHTGGIYVAEEKLKDAKSDLTAFVSTIPVWPLGTLKDHSGFATAKLKDLVEQGVISGVPQSNGDYFITKNELDRIRKIADTFVTLDTVIEGIIEDGCLFNLRTAAHRNDLLCFAANNDWWDLCVTNGEEYPIYSGLFRTLILKVDVDILKSKITSWVLGYRQDHQTQFTLLLKHYRSIYPKTTAALHKFYLNTAITKSVVDMADLMLYLIEKELKDATDKEIDAIVQSFAEEASLASSRELADFLYGAKYTKKQYVFECTGVTVETRAYSVQDFAIMVAPIVNTDIIAELNLVRKAVDNPKCAALWLYVAVHVFAAWRNTDYSKLHEPTLVYSPETTMQMIRSGMYSDADAVKVADNFIIDHKYQWEMPNKTSGVSGVAPLYFCCPEDCKAAFGLILSIAGAHYLLGKKSKPFVTVVCDKGTISAFFGPLFLAACGNQNFSGRRANKALMQAVEFEGREAGRYNPLVAYSLASRMRSHKANYGKLAETTDIYLRDANFSGLSPEYVLYQMFQRGVCSFAVDVMLAQCYGEKYAGLSVAAKTEVISTIGVPVSQLDIALRSEQKAMDTAITTIQSLGLEKQDMDDALRTIAAGRAHGKDMETQCLAKATDQGCKCQDRINCLGCRYELPSKALLLKYLVAHQKCQSISTSELENRKNQWLDANVILPKITEIAAHMYDVANAEEMQLYIDLIQEVEEYGIAGNCSA